MPHAPLHFKFKKASKMNLKSLDENIEAPIIVEVDKNRDSDSDSDSDDDSE